MTSSIKNINTTNQSTTVRSSSGNLADQELAAISRTVTRLKTDPKALKQAMYKAGIITKAGKLTKEYQS